MLSSWYNISSSKTTQVDSGPPVSKSSDSLRVRALSKEMEILRNEQTKFSDEMRVLEEKIDGIYWHPEVVPRSKIRTIGY